MSLRAAILGSGSGGNAVFIATERVRLLVDAGFSFRSLTRRMAAIGESIEDLDAVLVSHEHSDHVAGLPLLLKKTGVAVYLTSRTEAAIDWGERRPTAVERFEAGDRPVIGDLEIETFTVPHDAVDPVGFCVRRNGFKIGLATDLGYVPDSIKHSLRGCDLLAIESNHDVEMLKVGPYPWFVKQRVMSRVGHLSNQAVAEFLRRDFDRSTRALILTHLSGHNNHPEIARMTALESLESVGAGATRLLVADQDQPGEVFEF